MIVFTDFEPNLFELVGLLTHLFVFALGVGVIIGVVPLARGRRGGFGLVLMALAMTVMTLEPRWRLGAWGAAAYVVVFAVALWLLLGQEGGSSPRTGGEKAAGTEVNPRPEQGGENLSRKPRTRVFASRLRIDQRGIGARRAT